MEPDLDKFKKQYQNILYAIKDTGCSFKNQVISELIDLLSKLSQTVKTI